MSNTKRKKFIAHLTEHALDRHDDAPRLMAAADLVLLVGDGKHRPSIGDIGVSARGRAVAMRRNKRLQRALSGRRRRLELAARVRPLRLASGSDMSEQARARERKRGEGQREREAEREKAREKMTELK